MHAYSFIDRFDHSTSPFDEQVIYCEQQFSITTDFGVLEFFTSRLLCMITDKRLLSEKEFNQP